MRSTGACGKRATMSSYTGVRAIAIALFVASARMPQPSSTTRTSGRVWRHALLELPDGALAGVRDRAAPSSSSMRSSWLYFATRSVRLADPVLICPALVADREVGDGRVFGFARAVRDDRGVVRVARHRHGVERLGDGADLIELDQQRVADARRCRASESPDWSRTRRRRRAGRERPAPASASSSRPSRLRPGRPRSR